MLFMDLEPKPVVKEPSNLMVALIIHYNRRNQEIIEYHDLQTENDFKSHYSEVCDDKRKRLDSKKEVYPNAIYKITVQGILHGKDFKKDFACLDTYHLFLEDEGFIRAPLHKLRK